MTGITYRDAGVDLDAAGPIKETLKKLSGQTHGPNVFSMPGFFAGGIDNPSDTDSLLIASTDSVGTKVRIAIAAGQYKSLGHDIVNHCVNDALTTGARPLFFLDYIGIDSADEERIVQVGEGLRDACKAAGCAIIGGETAFLPGIYHDGDFATSTRVAADAADAVFGRGGGVVMSVVVLFSAFGALSGIVLAGPRVYYAMAKDGLLFKWIGTVHPRYRTPHRAILLQAIWSSVLVATGTYRALFTRVIYTEWIFFGLMALGVLIIRRRTDVQRQYSCWGYPWVPIVFALSGFAIVVNQIVVQPRDSLLGMGMVLIGLPIYYLWARKTYTGQPPGLIR